MAPLATAEDTSHARLSRSEFSVILALVVAQFLIAHGVVWLQHRDWDRAIFFSYPTIPLLVFLALRRRGRVRPMTLFLSSVEVAGAKFVLTGLVILGLLAAREGLGPLPLGVPAEPADTSNASAPAKPSRDETSAPGVDDPQMEIGAGGFSRRQTAVRAGQPVWFRASDGRLHTLRAARHGRWLFNVPLLPDGKPHAVQFEHGAGNVQIICMAHGRAEGTVEVLVHPKQ